MIATHDLGLMEQVDARRMILSQAAGSTSMTERRRAALTGAGPAVPRRPEVRVRTTAPIVPPANVAGNALVLVIAIMAFLPA